MMIFVLVTQRSMALVGLALSFYCNNNNILVTNISRHIISTNGEQILSTAAQSTY